MTYKQAIEIAKDRAESLAKIMHESVENYKFAIDELMYIILHPSAYENIEWRAYPQDKIAIECKSVIEEALVYNDITGETDYKASGDNSPFNINCPFIYPDRDNKRASFDMSHVKKEGRITVSASEWLAENKKK